MTANLHDLYSGNLAVSQITFHLPIKDWKLLKIPHSEEHSVPFDGHTTEDTIAILRDMADLSFPPKPEHLKTF